MCWVFGVPQITNISCYHFTPLHELKELRDELIHLCKSLELKGTILLATEGINLFVAGREASVDTLVKRLRRIDGLESLTPKVSLSDQQPFNRMLVRIKKEIIAFGVPEVNPSVRTSPKLAPQELKRWLDEGKQVVLLDTRNDYEVKLGTFKNAIAPPLRTFREFPTAVQELPEELKELPVVMFCTGGIRCEKAGPYMELQGFKKIHQLDGGILKYFEECGGAHYDGECFVFDQRVGVDPALRESPYEVCFACQAPLDENDQQDPRYILGESCPHCFRSDQEKIAARCKELEARIQQVTTPLPGAEAIESRRPIHIPASCDRLSFLEALCQLFPQVASAEWQSRLAEGRFVSYGGTSRSADHVVRAGERILQIFPAAAEPAVAHDIKVLYEDEAILIVNKPAPLPMHSSGRFHRNTLQHFIDLAYAPAPPPRAVHRLDANTSGILIFARTRHFAKLLQRQFLDQQVGKTYLACVMGQPPSVEFSCHAPISAEPHLAGSRSISAEGLSAHTDFRVLESCGDRTLLEVTPFTGRTNQIRLHLQHLGMPIIGDPTYLNHGEVGASQTLSLNDAPMQLHAWKLCVTHPLTKQAISFETPQPDWAQFHASPNFR